MEPLYKQKIRLLQVLAQEKRLQNLKKIDEAILLLHTAIGLFPFMDQDYVEKEFPIPSSQFQEEFAYFKLLGSVSEELNDYRDAAVYWKQILNQDPDKVSIHIKFADCFYNLNLFEEAITEYNEAIKLWDKQNETGVPDDLLKAKLLNNRGLAFLKLNLLQPAEADFDAAIQLWEENPVSHSHKGRVNFFLGKIREGLNNLERASGLVKEGKLGDVPRCKLAEVQTNFCSFVGRFGNAIATLLESHDDTIQPRQMRFLENSLECFFGRTSQKWETISEEI